jgi:hypothetical protein
MNQELPLSTLSFHWLLYPATVVQKWLKDPAPPTVDYFMFDMYYPAVVDGDRPLYACCFVHNTAPGYSNAADPDLLTPYESNKLVVNGPLQLSPNLVPAGALSMLLAGRDTDEDYLLFVPTLNTSARVYYVIYNIKRTTAGDVIDGDNPINTNPSPPATYMQ